jgi:hypothetical protein
LKEGRDGYGRREIRRHFVLENSRVEITSKKCRWEDNMKTDIGEMAMWVELN